MKQLTTDQKSAGVWLQITAGQGPKECGWVVAQVGQRLLGEAKAERIKAEIVEWLAFEKQLRKQDLIAPEALLSVLIRLEGDAVQAFARRWAGTIKWQGESLYRPGHKRQNWFVAVQRVALSTQDPVMLEQLKRQVTVEAIRSAGPGGQHVNKTSSAVRVTHVPSGVQVRVDSDRSQHRNKALALQRLAMLLAAEEESNKSRQSKDRWLQHYEVNRGAPLRTFSGSEFSEI